MSKYNRKSASTVTTQKQDPVPHLGQQVAKLVFAGIFAVLVGAICWLGRDFFTAEVQISSYGFPEWLLNVVEFLYRPTPLILLGIYIVQLVLVAVTLKKNTEKCSKVCRIVCICLGVISLVFNLCINFACGVFGKLIREIHLFDQGSDALRILGYVVQGFLGVMLIQMSVLTFPIMTFRQENHVNVATWLLTLIPGIGSTIAFVMLVIALFRGVRVGDDSDTYDVIIIKRD